MYNCLFIVTKCSYMKYFQATDGQQITKPASDYFQKSILYFLQGEAC